MLWLQGAVFCLILVTTVVAINRPVYKIVLTQKGYTQFLQYDVETPPLREFTFCTWIRIYDLGGDQSIFTYVANGNNRVLRLWLDSGGRSMKVSINGKLAASAQVDFVKDVWRHICLSYQSDYGAWALYVDAKLVSCEVTQSLYGFVLPRGGSLIIGYGTADDGSPRGLEGEVFGANMILTSTIEKNHTTKINNLYDSKSFRQNRVKGDENIKYIILNDLQTDEIHNNFEKSKIPQPNKTRSYIRLNTPYSHIEHDVGLDKSQKKSKYPNESNEKEILDFNLPESGITTSEKNLMNFWSLMNQAGHEGKFKTPNKNPIGEISVSSTRDLAMISEYETPPPISAPSPYSNFYIDKPQTEKPSIPTSVFSINEGLNNRFDPRAIQNNKKITNVLPDVETPPPPVKDTKVYGQWTSSKFAGSVLNYLKSINYYNKDKKTPSTIPVSKVSDNYPYASEFKYNKIRPSVKYQRRNFLDRKIIKKRGINSNEPEINVQIIKEDVRRTVLKQHAQTQPKNVEVTNRGEPTKPIERFNRNANHEISKENSESVEELYKPRPFKVPTIKTKSKVLSDYDLYRNNNLMTILPFLKSLEYFVEDSQNTGSDTAIRSSDSRFSKKMSQMYSKSLSNANKWHNVKSYNNDYTPRRINIESDENKNEIDAKIAEANRRYPSIRLKYKHENHKVVKNNDDPAIIKGRQLAMTVSNQSNTNRDSISIVKYNHGFLPSHEKILKNPDKMRSLSNLKQKRVNGKSNFNKNVKLGNALNERHVIGHSEEQKKHSFIGGDEKIPDINRYRSALDNENISVPPSLGPRICKNIELEDHALYVQNDESIDTSHIMSPVKKKNLGIEFIKQNYNKCSLVGSPFEKHYLLFIDWSKTPVRLFGGANPKTTTDLCGFFK